MLSHDGGISPLANKADITVSKVAPGFFSFSYGSILTFGISGLWNSQLVVLIYSNAFLMFWH